MDPIRILIADDDRVSRRIIESWLLKLGYQVETAVDGLTALEALDCPNAPKLALLDWEMPGMSGPEICRKIRARSDTTQPYLLLVTAREGKEHIAAAIQAGANDYLTKPFDVEELRVRLEVGVSLLEKRDLEAAARELERRVEEGNTELATAHANSERLLASIPCMLVGLDEQRRVTKWNKTAEDVFSLSVSEVLGQAFTDLQICLDYDAVNNSIIECGRTRRPTRIEKLSFACPGQRHGVLDLTIAPVLCPRQGTPLGVLLLGEDRTIQRLLEAQLSQAQKLESIGQLAAGVAHEINTPIQYIGDNTNFLATAFRDLRAILDRRRTGTDAPERHRAAIDAEEQADMDYLLEEVPQAINQTLDGVGHVSRIVKAMKEFAHPGTTEKVPVDLNHSIQTVIAVARNEWKYIAEVVTNLAADLPPVPGLPGELNQVLLNLLVNAAHAIAAFSTDGRKGTITFSTRRADNTVELRVTDTGCGIPEEIRHRVFDPFFTTKPVGQGTGQGLAIAHSVVVQQHGGVITFESEVGKGTTFILQFPTSGGRLTKSEFIKALSTERKLPLGRAS